MSMADGLGSGPGFGPTWDQDPATMAAIDRMPDEARKSALADAAALTLTRTVAASPIEAPAAELEEQV